MLEQLREVWQSDVFRAVWIALAALTVGAIAAYFWLRRRQEKYIRDKAVERVQGLLYKKAWTRAFDTLRDEAFSEEYEELSPLYRLDDCVTAMRNLYKQFAMDQRRIDEVQELVDRLHAIQFEMDEVRADADRKIQFLQRQFDQMRSGAAGRWKALPPPGDNPPPAPAEPEVPDTPPFEEEDPADRRATGSDR